MINAQTFRPLAVEDRSTIECLRALEEGEGLTAYSFPALYCWKEAFSLSILVEEDYFLVRCAGAYYYPCGSDAGRQRALASLLDAAAAPELRYLSAEHAAELKRLYPNRFFIEPRRESAEYIYETAAIADPSGAHGRNFRRRLRDMKRLPFQVREATSSDLPEMNRITNAWSASKIGTVGGYAGDAAPTMLALEQFTALGLRGMVAELYGQVVAFMLGYKNTPDMVTLCMTKYDSSVPPDVLYLLLQAFAGSVTCPYLNLEEDMGDLGLRAMKELLHPARLDMVYTARQI